MNMLKKYLEQIATQNKIRKTERSCRNTELCNYFSSNSKYKYTDFVAFIQCGVTKGNEEEIYCSSDSGSDTKDKDNSFDSNSEAEFGDNEEISSSSEEEDRNVLQKSPITQITNEANEDMNSSTESNASNSDLELGKLVENKYSRSPMGGKPYVTKFTRV